MNIDIRFKSIATQWFFEVFVIVAVAVTIAGIAFSLVYSSLYTERVESLADDYSYDFLSLASAGSDSFSDVAINLSNTFEYKNKIEVQVLDTDGNVIVSTTGFQPTGQRMPDYERAAASADGTATFKGRNADGERIFAKTTVLKGAGGETLGSFRWITSYEKTNRKILHFDLLILAACICVLALSSFSGLFFIKSIIRPIRDVSNMARKIAMGDFQTRIDITKNDEIGELCDTINYMAAELSQAETIKNDFISSVSHELRTPLTAIRGWGETAKMSVGSDEALVERGLDVVLSEADRLSSLVEELLDFSRMQSGRLTVNTRPIDISELLADAANMYTELAKKQGIELSYTPPVESSTVMGDPDRLKQVFINIIDNAVKYTQKGGLVLVVQSREEGCVRIQVKDTGVGIPAQDIDRVKEKFFKSNKTVRGSGIGLAVADEIIKQHKGLLFLESTEGVGTTVTIVLPLCELPEEELALEESTVTELSQNSADTLPEEESLENESDLQTADQETIIEEGEI